MRFRRIPYEVEALQAFDGNHRAVCTLVGGANGGRYQMRSPAGLSILTRGGWVEVPRGWWVVRKADGSLDYHRPDVFESIYESVGGPAAPREEAEP